MKISLVSIDYWVLLLYVAALFIVGLFVSRRKPGTNKDIFLGGRSLRWWQIGFSLFSANAGPIMLIGFSSLGFSHGMIACNFEWLAWIFLLLLAMVFLPRYLTSGISTMPQFLLMRFGRRAYNFLILYSLVSILVVWLGSALYAGGLILSQIFGCPLVVAVLGVALISTSYTAIGGFRAVVRTGIFQSLIIILSSLVLTALALQKAGGIYAVVSGVPEGYWKLLHGEGDPEYSWIAVLAGYPVVAVYYWCADQTIVQKTLAARNIREGQYGAVFMAVLKLITPVIFILPGIVCYTLFKGQIQSDHAYVTLVEQLMPAGWRGLCIAALTAALIDTLSSGLNSFSTVFTLDIIGRVRPLDESGRRRTGKWLTVAAAMLGVGISILFDRSGRGLFELSQGLVSILAPPLSVVFLGGMLWKRMTGLAAGVVLYGGGLVCLVVGACYVLNYPFKGFWPHFLLLSVYLFMCLALVAVVISLWAPEAGAAAGAGTAGRAGAGVGGAETAGGWGRIGHKLAGAGKGGTVMAGAGKGEGGIAGSGAGAEMAGKVEAEIAGVAVGGAGIAGAAIAGEGGAGTGMKKMDAGSRGVWMAWGIVALVMVAIYWLFK